MTTSTRHTCQVLFFGLIAGAVTIASQTGIAHHALTQSKAASDSSLLSELVALEKAALDRWIKGDPQGYLDLYSPDVTYFDPMRDRRVDGIEGMKTWIAAMQALPRPPVKDVRYEMIAPSVQRYGEVAVLTFQIVNYGKVGDGPERVLTRWNTSEVYGRSGGKWRIVHSHFSFTKPDVKPPVS